MSPLQSLGLPLLTLQIISRVTSLDPRPVAKDLLPAQDITGFPQASGKKRVRFYQFLNCSTISGLDQPNAALTGAVGIKDRASGEDRFGIAVQKFQMFGHMLLALIFLAGVVLKLNDKAHVILRYWCAGSTYLAQNSRERVDFCIQSCKIAAMDWNDLSFLLAVQRGGSLRQAARLKQVDKTTITRRIAALEASLDAVLIERDGQGALVLTPMGQEVVRHADTIEEHTRLIGDVTGKSVASGRSWVRLTAVPLIANRLLLPNLSRLLTDAPDVGIELIAEPRDLSLVYRDADIGLRLARPREGGQAVLARRLGVLEYGAYVARSASDASSWIGFDRTMQYLPHAAAIAAIAVQPGQSRAPVAVNDGETLYQAVLAGMGISLLPKLIAAPDPGLREVTVDAALPSREIWCLIRRDIRDTQRVAAVTNWLASIVGSGG